MDNFISEELSAEYEILSCLKSGESSSAYIIYDRACGRKAVLKTGSAELMENEARTLAQLSCKGVPQVYRCFESGGRSCLIRQYIQGENLREYVEKNGGFSERKAVRICAEVCGILSVLHGRKPPVVHRDIKSDNIIITPEDEVCLIDFGTAREFDVSSSRDTQVMGTPAVAPPEQFGYSQTDERSDVYAVGVLLHELVTGSSKLAEGKVSRGLERIIKKCTAFSPEERYENACAVKKALVKFQKRGKAAVLSIAACCAAAVLCFAAAHMINDNAQLPDTPMVSEASGKTIKTAVYDTVTDKNRFHTFADKAVEEEVCRMLGKAAGTVTFRDLESITQLALTGSSPVDGWSDIDIHGTGITVNGVTVTDFGNVKSLEDLAFMPNLTTVVLCCQEISDLSPLAGLNIVRLALHDNMISDISPLKDCVRLEELYISNNPVSDFSSLSELPLLSSVNAGATDIETLDDLAKIKKLEVLDISFCYKLNDFSALAEMELRDFASDTLFNCENAVGLLNGMTSIERLFVWNLGEIESTEQLSGLANIQYMLLDYCGGLESLEGINGFAELEVLSLQNTTVTDLSPLAGNETIEYIFISETFAEDYSPLAEMSALECIVCSEAQAEDVKKAIEGKAGINIVISNLD